MKKTWRRKIPKAYRAMQAQKKKAEAIIKGENVKWDDPVRQPLFVLLPYKGKLRRKLGPRKGMIRDPDGGVRRWYYLNTKNGKRIGFSENKWSAILRQVLTVPRDGRWYILGDTTGLPKKEQKKCLSALRVQIHRYGHRATEVIIRMTYLDGIAVRWIVGDGKVVGDNIAQDRRSAQI